MSAEPENTPQTDADSASASGPASGRDDPLIAAEWALGLLEGEELFAARGKQAIDPDFAWRKEWWDNWFAPLADEIALAEPSPRVWEQISASLAEPSPVADVIQLRARVKRWQVVSALTSAAAAIAVMVSLFGPSRTPAPVTPAVVAAAMPDTLAATMPVGDTGLRLDVTYVPQTQRLLVGAIGLAADGVHDHELWLVPPHGGELKSLGVVVPGEVRSIALPSATAAEFGTGVRLLLTREPLGGKPHGQDAGPAVAEGTLTAV